MAVSVLIPTRGRPKRLKQCLESLHATKTGEVEVLLYVDDDDPIRDEIIYPGKFVGPRVGLSLAIHKLIELASHPFMMLGSDDIIFKSEGWDQHLVNAMPKDGIGATYGRDGWNNNLNHFCFHRTWYDLTGLFPKDFEHFGPDGYIGQVCMALNRRIHVEEVLIEHHHFKNQKATRDLVYDEPRNNGCVERDKNRLRAYEKTRIPEDIEILRRHCERFSQGA